MAEWRNALVLYVVNVVYRTASITAAGHLQLPINQEVQVYAVSISQSTSPASGKTLLALQGLCYLMRMTNSTCNNLQSGHCEHIIMTRFTQISVHEQYTLLIYNETYFDKMYESKWKPKLAIF